MLRDLTAHLPGPGLTAIVGPSGSGKTTLLADPDRRAADCGGRAGSRSPGRDLSDARPGRLALPDRLDAPAPWLTRRHARGEPPRRRARRHRRAALGDAGAGSRWPTSCDGLPERARHARSVKTAPGSRPASGPGSRWPGSCSPTDRTSSSTSPPRTWTPMTEQVLLDDPARARRPLLRRRGRAPTGRRWRPRTTCVTLPAPTEAARPSTRAAHRAGRPWRACDLRRPPDHRPTRPPTMRRVGGGGSRTGTAARHAVGGRRGSP